MSNNTVKHPTIAPVKPVSPAKPVVAPGKQTVAPVTPPNNVSSSATAIAALDTLFKAQVTDAIKQDPYSHAYFANAGNRAMIAWGDCGPTPEYPLPNAYKPTSLVADNFFLQVTPLPTAVTLLTEAFAIYSAFANANTDMGVVRPVLKELADLCIAVQP